jgi:hypothetical protein
MRKTISRLNDVLGYISYSSIGGVSRYGQAYPETRGAVHVLICDQCIIRRKHQVRGQRCIAFAVAAHTTLLHTDTRLSSPKSKVLTNNANTHTTTTKSRASSLDIGLCTRLTREIARQARHDRRPHPDGTERLQSGISAGATPVEWRYRRGDPQAPWMDERPANRGRAATRPVK